MAFQVPKSKASIKQNRFEFVIDGQKYDVPLLRYLQAWQIEAFSKAEGSSFESSLDAVYAVFGEPGTTTGDVIRTLDQEQLNALTDAYLEASKVTPGESDASSPS